MNEGHRGTRGASLGLSLLEVLLLEFRFQPSSVLCLFKPQDFLPAGAGQDSRSPGPSLVKNSDLMELWVLHPQFLKHFGPKAEKT